MNVLHPSCAQLLSTAAVLTPSPSRSSSGMIYESSFCTCAASSTPSTAVAARRIWRKQFSQSAPADHVPGYSHLPPHRWTILYHGCARSSASGRSHMRVLPPGTLCPTTSAPCLILSSSENCWNHSILVKLLTFDDFCVSLCALASGWLL